MGNPVSRMPFRPDRRGPPRGPPPIAGIFKQTFACRANMIVDPCRGPDVLPPSAASEVRGATATPPYSTDEKRPPPIGLQVPISADERPGVDPEALGGILDEGAVGGDAHQQEATALGSSRILKDPRDGGRTSPTAGPPPGWIRCGRSAPGGPRRRPPARTAPAAPPTPWPSAPSPPRYVCSSVSLFPQLLSRPQGQKHGGQGRSQACGD